MRATRGMKMETLNRIISDTLALDKAADEGPWFVSVEDGSPFPTRTVITHDTFDPDDGECIQVCELYSHKREESELIAEYRTSAPKLAAALRVCLEALEKCGCQADWCGSHGACTVCEALAAAERIVGQG